jgi:hypothetical protein
METIDLLSARVLRISDEARLQAAVDAGLFMIERSDGVIIGPLKYEAGGRCMDCALLSESSLTCVAGWWNCVDGLFVECKNECA